MLYINKLTTQNVPIPENRPRAKSLILLTLVFPYGTDQTKNKRNQNGNAMVYSGLRIWYPFIGQLKEPG